MMPSRAGSRRKYIDCREYPSEIKCTLRISGSRDEVMQACLQHVITVHGLEDSPELPNELRNMMRDDTSEEQHGI